MFLATTQVEDFDRFLKIFSTKGAEKRKEHGSKGSTVFRDPNEDDRVWLLFDWDEEGFQNFVADPEVPPILKEAGHKSRPQAAELGGKYDGHELKPKEAKDDFFVKEMHRSFAPVAIADDLLFATDFSGFVHCLDVKTGQQHWSHTQAIGLLALTAIATGVVSEVLVHSIEPTIKAWGVPREFIGIIVVPFVGNVAEHFSAVRLAASNDAGSSMAVRARSWSRWFWMTSRAAPMPS